VISVLIASSAILTFPAQAAAGARPQVDLSVAVSTTPVPFVPGGRGTVTLTVHNAGPDTAGVPYLGAYAIDVIQQAFIVTSSPPPYEIRDPVSGCTITETITEPLPDGSIALIWEFYFEIIPPNVSRTCTFDIEFYPFTRESFETGWRAIVDSNEDDLNLANNQVDYIFRPPPTVIPTLSRPGLAALCISLLALVWHSRLGKQHERMSTSDDCSAR
jgi:hypothetical protein